MPTSARLLAGEIMDLNVMVESGCGAVVVG
jgi:environmental stress-induced protein Ves